MKRIEKNTNLWAACSAGRRIYKYQINKTSEVKIQTLQSVLNEKYPEYLSFGHDFKAMASQLCDSQRFARECGELQLQAENVAQHVVFEEVQNLIVSY